MFMFTETCFVPAMRDAATVHRITSALAALNGVLHIRADVPNRRLIITYQEPATPERLRHVIETLGYEVMNGLTPLHPTDN
jgi:copper chaperone CopZ